MVVRRRIPPTSTHGRVHFRPQGSGPRREVRFAGRRSADPVDEEVGERPPRADGDVLPARCPKPGA